MVQFDVATLSGHDSYSLVPEDAFKRIQELSADGYWLYKGDGSLINSEELTESAVASLEKVTAMKALAGGVDVNIINRLISFNKQFDEVQEESSEDTGISDRAVPLMVVHYVPVNIKEGALKPSIFIEYNSDLIPELANLRKHIFTGGSTFLDQYLTDELNKFKTTYKI